MRIGSSPHHSYGAVADVIPEEGYGQGHTSNLRPCVVAYNLQDVDGHEFSQDRYNSPRQSEEKGVPQASGSKRVQEAYGGRDQGVCGYHPG